MRKGIGISRPVCYICECKQCLPLDQRSAKVAQRFKEAEKVLMFIKLSEYITQQLEKGEIIQSNNRELYKYGFQQGLILLLNFATSIVIGVIFGKVLESILLLAAYIPLRSYAGGHHSDSSEKCYVVSTLVTIVWMLILKFLILPTSCWGIILLIGTVVCFVFSPVDNFQKPLDEDETRVYRKCALIVLVVEVCLWICLIIIEHVFVQVIPLSIFTEAIMLIMGKMKTRRVSKKDSG